MDNVESIDTDTTAEEVLLASSNHDILKLEALFKNGASANIEDEDTGLTPLHAALESCEHDTTNTIISGEHPSSQEGRACETIKLLLENGAIWNDLNHNNETPGCTALRLGLKEAYKLLVEAGVAAELLIHKLDEYNVLPDDSTDDEAGELMENGDIEEAAEAPELIKVSENNHTSLPTDPSVQNGLEDAINHEHHHISSDRYLNSALVFGADRLLDADDNGVMMSWETEIMRKSATALISGRDTTSRLNILNVGHGMGIIDEIFQESKPAQHHIIEAHPEVLKRMQTNGWYAKPGVIVHEGKWQDVVKDIVTSGISFDAIYFDTFAEDYSALREFFTETLIGIMDNHGRFGFFNGLGADRQVCYDVYTRVVELDLQDAGFDTAWTEMKIEDLDQIKTWEGVRRKYWALDTYRMPICTFIG